MTTYCDLSQNIEELLGTDYGAGNKKNEQRDLRAAVLKGFPFSSFETVQKEIDLPQQQLSEILGIPTRTIARRKEDRHLSPVESDRLYRVARIIAFTVEVLGDIDKARVWLKSPNRGLGDIVPLTLLDTDIGVCQVEDVLKRIKYGIYG